MVLPIKSCKPEIIFPKLSIIKTTFLSTVLEERRNSLFIFSLENVTQKHRHIKSYQSVGKQKKHRKNTEA